MNTRKSLRLWMVGGTIIAMAALTAAQIAFHPGAPKPDKINPITFHLDPRSPLETGLAPKIEAANAELAKLLAELRSGRKPSAEEIKTRFGRTYLADPVLWDEGGKAHSGWFGPEGVLDCLARLVWESSFIQPQSVNVYLEYLPFKSAAFSKANPGLDLSKIDTVPHAIEAWSEAIDFLVYIRTVLAYAPYDDPPIIGNKDAMGHRTLCWQ